MIADKLNQQLSEWQKQKLPVLFLVSGGSAFKVLDQIDLEILTLLGSDLTIGVLDERYSNDPKINNFTQFMQTTLFKEAENTGAVFIDTRVKEGELPEDLAARWEKVLKDWRVEHPQGKIAITQGMGPDGHTAGIMPFPEDAPAFEQLFNQPDKWVVSYDAGNKNPLPLRVTTTLTFLKLVDYSIFYVMGTEKREPLRWAYSHHGSFATTPARIVQEMKHVQLVTDLQS